MFLIFYLCIIEKTNTWTSNFKELKIGQENSNENNEKSGNENDANSYENNISKLENLLIEKDIEYNNKLLFHKNKFQMLQDSLLSKENEIIVLNEMISNYEKENSNKNDNKNESKNDVNNNENGIVNISTAILNDYTQNIVEHEKKETKMKLQILNFISDYDHSNHTSIISASTDVSVADLTIGACVCVCICVSMCMYLYMYVSVFISVYAHYILCAYCGIYVGVCVHIYVYIHLVLFIFTCAYVYRIYVHRWVVFVCTDLLNKSIFFSLAVILHYILRTFLKW